MSLKIFISKIILIAIPFFSSFFVNASLTTVGNLIQVSILITEDNNDCSGYFGGGNSGHDCQISHVPTPNSPIFAELMDKTDNANFNNNSDWNFDINNQLNQIHPGVNGTGQWNYNGNEYPGVSFWVAKASNDFVLNWMINDSQSNINTCNSNEFSIECLSLAVSVTTGAWTTPLTTNGQNAGSPRDLSHISFYGNQCEDNCGPTTEVPEPSTLAIFVLGMMGLASRRFKKQS